MPRAGLEAGHVREAIQPVDVEVRNELELQNKKLKRRLSRTRIQSRERLVSIEQERDQRNAENAMLRQECENLRSLFIKQQQQQMAFWSGPFMETVMGRKSSTQALDEDLAVKNVAQMSAVLSAASPAKAVSKLGEHCARFDCVDQSFSKLGEHCARFDPIDKLTVASRVKEIEAKETMAKSSSGPLLPRPSNYSTTSTRAPDLDAKNTDPSDCVRSLLKDRDYWQDMANQLTSEAPKGASPLGAPLVHLSLHSLPKDTINVRSTSQLSSQSSPSFHLSDGNADIAWSDSGTESTSATEAHR